MACTGTYLGECCEPPAACAAWTELFDRLTLWLPFTWEALTSKCGYPESGFLAWRYIAQVSIVENRFDANEECKGEWNATLTHVIESTGAKCPSYSETCTKTGNWEFMLNGGCSWLSAFDCALGVVARGVDVYPERDEPDYTVTDDVSFRTRTYRYVGVAGDSLTLTIVETIELLTPFDIAGWVAESIQDLVDQHAVGKHTTIERRCQNITGTTVTDIADETAVPGAARVFVQAAAGEVLFLGSHVSFSAVRPYCIRERQEPIADCPDLNICTPFAKQQDAGITETDCVDLMPGPNRSLARVACPC